MDLWKERIDAWNSNDLPIFEPGLDELVCLCVVCTHSHTPRLTEEADTDTSAVK